MNPVVLRVFGILAPYPEQQDFKKAPFLVYLPGVLPDFLISEFFRMFFSEIITSTPRISVWRNQGGSERSREGAWAPVVKGKNSNFTRRRTGRSDGDRSCLQNALAL